jgi:hypothetical protein
MRVVSFVRKNPFKVKIINNKVSVFDMIKNSSKEELLEIKRELRESKLRDAFKKMQSEKLKKKLGRKK